MKTKPQKSAPFFVDPDDAPPWTAEQFARAEISIGEAVLRPATGTLTRGPGRPKKADAKQVVSLRLEPDVIEAYKAQGPGWQTRMSAAVRHSISLDKAAGHLRTTKSGKDPFPPKSGTVAARPAPKGAAKEAVARSTEEMPRRKA